MAYRNRYLRFPGGKPKAVTLSYDDGIRADLKLAEIINKHDMKCTFNIPSAWITPEGTPGHLGEKEIKEYLIDAGHEIAVHCADHRAPAVTRAIAGIRQIIDNRDFLERVTGTFVRGMAYPNEGIRTFQPGMDYETVKQYLKNLDIAYSRSLGGDNDSFEFPQDWYNWIPTAHHDNPNIFDYIDKFLAYNPEERVISDRSSKIFYMWGHSYEFNNNDNWDRLEIICEKIGGKEDTWYATNIEIYDYIQAYNSLRYTADEKKVYNPTLIDVYFDIDGKKYVIKSGETIIIDQ